MKRNSFLTLALGGLFCAALFGCATRAETDTTSTMKPIAVRQIVSTDNAHERTVVWQLSDNISSALEIREKGNDAILSFPAASQFLPGTQGEADSYLYEATATGLRPGTSYEYRTRAKNAVSAWMPLRTDDGTKFSALIFPDSQSADYGVWKDTATKGFAALPTADFFIMMGDLVDNGQDEHQWQSWFSAVEAPIQEIPVAPLMGNHEAYSLDWKACRPERFLAHFALPGNGDPNHGELFWSFDWGPVHFAVLNTDMPEIAEWYPNLLAAQETWLRQDIAATKKPWKIVLMHRDPLQYRIEGRPERLEGFSEEGLAFMPLFDELGVDAVLSAHLHTYRNRGHIKNFERDETGPLYILTGVAGDVRYPNLWTNHALDITVAPQPETDNFLTMEADETKITLRAYRTDGMLLDETVLEK